jgi:predicted ArsR family transcriptional regulator
MDRGKDVEMTNSVDQKIEGTRRQLLVLLRRSRRSINELARSLGISDNAVRVHLAGLQRDGLVESAGVERSTGGKPAQLYQITPEAEELFPKAYSTVFNGLIEVLAEERGREDLTRLLRRVGSRAVGDSVSPEATLEGRVREAAAILRRLGGDVEVDRDGDDWLIQGYACPLSAVTSQHEEVCCLAESLVEEVTGAPTTEICTRGERPRCGFRIVGGGTP